MKKYCLILFLALLTFQITYADGSKKFLKLYKKGKTYYNKIDYAQAIPYFEQAEEEGKKSAAQDTLYFTLLSEMADSYYNLKNTDKANTYYSAALRQMEQRQWLTPGFYIGPKSLPKPKPFIFLLFLCLKN